MVVIKLFGQDYKMKFGMGALRILSEIWGCKGIQSTAAKFQAILPETAGETDLTFDQIDQIGDLIIAGIQNAYPGEVINLDRDEVMDQIIFDSEKLNLVIKSFMLSFPQSGNPQPQAPLGKTKKIKPKK